MLTDLILGTAGHIDHGKSSLIRALTGKDTARLPEEKKRGITIELGYSFLELPPFRLGIVDVPGHEKFVRQMLSGATGMDLVLLVIAADDSVKQQTREHLDILRMLDLPAGVIALTKTDLVDPDWLDMVKEEIRELVADSFLENAPIVPCSTKTGDGMEDLKKNLLDAARKAAASNRQARMHEPFRMAIDRSFPVEGYGTVVTGSVGSGILRIGDMVEIQPGGISARIRGLQNHDLMTDEVHRGQRAAINLGGIHHEQINRGNEIAAPGHLQPSKRFFTEIFLLDSVRKPLSDRNRVRFHLGTSEFLAVVRTIGVDSIDKSGSGYALIMLPEETVATWGQPFVIRSESPMATIGGGRIIHSNAPMVKKIQPEDIDQVRDLASSDMHRRAAAAIWFSDPDQWRPADLVRTTGVLEPERIVDELVKRKILVPIRTSASREVILHAGKLAQFGDSIRRSLVKFHQQFPLKIGHPLSSVLSSVRHVAGPELLNLALKELVREKVVIQAGPNISLEGMGPRLTRNERLQFDELITTLHSCGLKAPTISELKSLAQRSRESIPQLVEIAVGSGEAFMLGSEIVIHRKTLNSTINKLLARFPPPKTFTVSELREFLETSRKYAVPLCELMDELGVTIRNGDERMFNDSAMWDNRLAMESEITGEAE